VKQGRATGDATANDNHPGTGFNCRATTHFLLGTGYQSKKAIRIFHKKTIYTIGFYNSPFCLPRTITLLL
jgi:hypothetical protein